MVRQPSGANHEVVCRPGCTLQSGCPITHFCTSMDTSTIGHCVDNTVLCPQSPFGSGLELDPKGKGAMGAIVGVQCSDEKKIYNTSPDKGQTLVCSQQGWLANDGKTRNPFYCKSDKAPTTCSSISPNIYHGEVRINYKGMHEYNCLPGYIFHPLDTAKSGNSANVTCINGVWHIRSSFGKSFEKVIMFVSSLKT